MEFIKGFSKLSKEEKINWLVSQYDESIARDLRSMTRFWCENQKEQKVFDEFSENTISNFILPFGIAPNFVIDGEVYSVPMVIEESSVVAAASLSAKFWMERGGFKAQVISNTKVGHIHFTWSENPQEIEKIFTAHKKMLLEKLSPLNENMLKRGGGIVDIQLKNQTEKLKNYYQIELTADTCDAMGANFINTLLECLAKEFEAVIPDSKKESFQVIMCILSNFTPQSLVKVQVDCPIDEIDIPGISNQEFVQKFVRAVEIARVDRSRAVTHNKGIMNGIDSVVLATGNDFRAIEACAHAYAAKDGQYRSLTEAKIVENHFYFSLEIPLALGSVGGLTRLHPMAKTSLDILNNPSSQDLMKICAAVGLAQNFAAVRSLVTTGIQKGHMKLHLLNILSHFEASDLEKEKAKVFFKDKIVSHSEVRNFLGSIRFKH